MQVLQQIKNDGVSNVVELIEIKYDEAKPSNSSIIMKKYDGTLNELLHLSKGNVLFTLSHILPIIKALETLSNNTPPIFHRDIKPENILFERCGDDYRFVLSDFGICYIDDESSRITPEEIGIGARLFIAPEYEIGRVEEISSAGDIFSIGKIIWWLIWGDDKSLLPSNFWFVDNYDLEKRFPNNKEIVFANSIIASCLDIKPENRTSYSSLIQRIESFLQSPEMDFDRVKQLRVKQYQERRNLEQIEIKRLNKAIVNTFSITLLDTLSRLIGKYPDLQLLKLIYRQYSSKSKDGISFTTANVENNTAHYLLSGTYEDVYIDMSYHPANKDEKYASLTFSYYIPSGLHNVLKLFYNNKKEIYSQMGDNVHLFCNEKMNDFIEGMISDLISN